MSGAASRGRAARSPAAPPSAPVLTSPFTSALTSFLSSVLASVVVAVVGLLATALPASAHNVLDSTDPQNGATVARVPAEVVLTFDEPAIAMGTQIVVRGPGGNAAVGAARLVDNTVRQSVASGSPAGRYTVEWRVTSEDGHPVSGTFGFTATAAGGSSTVATTATPSPVPAGSSGRLPTVVVVILVLVLVGAVGTTVAVVRRRRTPPEP